MQLRRVVAVPSRAAVVVVLALYALAGCSSSTEPKSDVTPDGFRVSLALSTSSIVVGDYMMATLILENTTDDTISRFFAADDFGPWPMSSSEALQANGFGNGFFGNIIEPHTFVLAPHETSSHSFALQAVQAGTAYVSMCFPESDAGPHPAICVTKPVTVKLN